jgi:pimeloyl-ACP methyl ester carboxylesterase
LHGVTLTAELNWSAVFPVLGRHFRVLAFDQRGHGRGLACAGGYRLEAPGCFTATLLAACQAVCPDNTETTGPADPPAGLTAS